MPGRPRIGYQAAPDGPAGRRRYRLLAEMLTSLVAGTMPEPGSAAEEAGREWGAYLAEQPPPYQRLTAEEALAKLTEIMEELGFAPQAEADGERQTGCACVSARSVRWPSVTGTSSARSIWG